MENNPQNLDSSDWILGLIETVFVTDKLCKKFNKVHGIRDQLNILEPRGSKISIRSWNIPNPIQCDPDNSDESMLTIIKHGKLVIWRFSTWSSA